MALMTTINEIFKKFNIKRTEKFQETIGKTDIGNYTFTDIDTSTPFIKDFTNKNNPHILFRVNEDKDTMILYIEQPDKTVKATTWLLRNNDKIQKTFPPGNKFFN